MERLRSERWTLPVAILGGAAIGMSVVLGVQATENPSSASQTIRAFEQTYTEPGKCLHGTPFDPANGAFIDIRHDKQSGEEILSDMPHAANAYQPSVLFWAANGHNEFSAADHYTEAFLGKLLCSEPGQP